jgi:anti-sigma B factor antagonist
MAPSFEIRDHDGWAVVDVTGELDVFTAPVLRAQLVDLVEDGSVRLVLDMDAVTFIDSTGLGVLVGVLKRVRTRDGELRVVASVDPVLRTMRITGLHRVLGMFSSVVEATAAGEPVAPS